MGEDQGVAIRGANPGDDAIRPGADLVDGLAARPRAAPDGPARVQLPDVDGDAALEIAVVPFLEVGVGDATSSNPASAAVSAARDSGLVRTSANGVAGKPAAELDRLVAPGVGQRDVGPPGVAAEARPLGLAMADEPHVRRCHRWRG